MMVINHHFSLKGSLHDSRSKKKEKGWGTVKDDLKHNGVIDKSKEPWKQVNRQPNSASFNWHDQKENTFLTFIPM